MKVPSPRGAFAQLRTHYVSIENGLVCLNRKPIVKKDTPEAAALCEKVQACMDIMQCRNPRQIDAIAQRLRYASTPEVYTECLAAVAQYFWLTSDYELPTDQADELIRDASKNRESPPDIAEAFGIWFVKTIQFPC